MKKTAVGAVGAQAAQALASFVLQAAVARSLGLREFGVFAILYGVVVLSSGLVTGFVGDTLAVLDRRDRMVRSALQQAALAISGTAAVVAAVIIGLCGLTAPVESVLFAVAVIAFCLEEVVRRTLMAHLLFWRVALIDAVGLVVALVVIGGAAVLGLLVLSSFLLAIAVGQVVATIAGVALLPRDERFLHRLVGGGRLTVLRYGGWRALQQMLRPGLLTAVRAVVGVTAGLAATGALETARVYTAPALLLVSGLSSYFFSSFARQRDAPLDDRLRRADRMVAAMLALTVVIGVVALAALPLAGPLVFRSAPDPVAVIGWLVYTVSVAMTTPYGSLAAVTGRQAVVFGVRAVDTLASLLAVAVALLVGAETSWAPALLAIGSLAGGLVLRLVVVPRAVAASAGERLRVATTDG